MSKTIPALPADVAATIQGDVSGQVIVGDDNLQLHVGTMHGGVINLTPPQQPVVTPRAAPVMLLPRPFPGLLDREEAIGSVARAVATRSPVEIHGAQGLGKTVLLRHLAHQTRPAVLGDGVVHLSADAWSVADVLQGLYEAFYQTSVPFKPSRTQTRAALQDKRALLLIDEPGADRDGIGALLDAVPESAVIITGRNRLLFGEGRSIALPGLPAGDAVALVERELGRPLTSAEEPAARRLCAALGHNPLRVLRAAAQVRDGERGIATLADAASAASAKAGDAQVMAALSAEEREVVALLAAVPGAAVDERDVATLTGIPDAPAVLRGLLGRRVVEAHSPRYSLAGGLVDVVGWESDLLAWRERALDHFASRAEALHDRPDDLRPDLGVCLALLDWAVSAKRWSDVVRLGRAIDASLALALRWDAWERVLRRVGSAGHAMRDRGTEAWALHQLGTRALCLGERRTARPLLLQALDLRESLHDHVGAAITRHNLWFFPGLPPGGNGDGRNGDGGQGGHGANGHGGGHGGGGHGRTLIRRLRHAPTWLKIAAAGLAVIAAEHALTSGPDRQPAGPTRVSGPSAPAVGMVRARPAVLNFPDQAVGTASPVQRVTVRNLGRKPMMVIGVGADGPDQAEFAVEGAACVTELEPGTDCQVTATFTPHTVGVHSAEVAVDLNAAAGALRVPLTGVGVPPGAGRLRLEPETLAFQGQAVGTTSTPSRVAARNVGGRPVAIRYVERDGQAAQDFAVDTTKCPAAVEPGAVCPLAVTFRPTAAGVRSAAMVVVSDAENGRVTARLAGTGQGGGPGLLRADPPSLTFAGRAAGSTSEPKLVTLANVGETPVTVRELRAGGEHPGDFAVDGRACTGAVLDSGRRCQVAVSFTPEGGGERSATVTVTSDGAEPRTTVALHGLPLDPRIELLPDFLDFGTQLVGKPTASEPLFVHNAGGSPVRVGAVEIRGSGAAGFTVDAKSCQRVLGADESCELAVTFTPPAAGDHGARVVVGSDAAGTSAEATLSGRGESPEKRIEVTPLLLPFDDQQAGTESPARFVQVKSVGNQPVTVGRLEVVPDDEASRGVFAAARGTCGSTPLQPGGVCQVAVTFTPAAPASSYGAKLLVHSDAPGSQPTVVLSGASLEERVKKLRVVPTELSLDDQPGHNEGSVVATSVGTDPVTIDQVTIAPADGVFTAKGDCANRRLLPGQPCKVTVAFAPPQVDPRAQGAGDPTYHATLQLGSDAVEPAIVQLTGTVLTMQHALEVEPQDLSFEQPAGSESLPQTVTVKSVGTKPVTIAGAKRTGSGADAFTADDRACRGEPLQPGRTCQLAVTFLPRTAGESYQAELEVVADAAGDRVVTLTGKSTEPEVLADLLPKGIAPSGDGQTVTVTVGNAGRAGAPASRMRLWFGQHPEDSTYKDLPGIPAGGSIGVPITLASECAYGCELTVQVDDEDVVREADEDNNEATYSIGTRPSGRSGG